jgi:hypothetical protein
MGIIIVIMWFVLAYAGELAVDELEFELPRKWFSKWDKVKLVVSGVKYHAHDKRAVRIACKVQSLIVVPLWYLTVLPVLGALSVLLGIAVVFVIIVGLTISFFAKPFVWLLK